jgi:spermidine synthase
VKPREVLGTGVTPAGEPISLAREGGHLIVRVRGVSLMSSAVHGSEEQMAEVACRPLRERPGVRVLVGGLGMGFTLRAALDALALDAEVVVAELVPVVAEWNRGVLGDLAKRPLDDPRTRLVVGDVSAIVREAASREHESRFDAILLDVDNGPDALTAEGNRWLYELAGLKDLRAALRPSGTVVFWSAFESPRFEATLRGGFDVEVIATRARANVKKGSRHTLYVGRVR